MNALLIYPECPDTFWSFKHALKFLGKKAGSPPLGLLTVAAMLPKEWHKRLVDMQVTKLTDGDLAWADMAMVSAMAVQLESAKGVIARCRKAGVRIVAGGPLFTIEPGLFPEVDHFVLNEAEVTLPPFLADLERGCPKPVYTSAEFASMADTPVPLWELADLRQYGWMGLQYSRGCPFQCDFCNVTSLFGRRLRAKSSAQVLAELDALYSQGWRSSVFFVDDNFIGNRQWLKTDLLPALIQWQRGKGVPFQTQVSINLADDDALMRLMVEAGFQMVFVGIETPSADALAECHKKQNEGRDLVADVKRLQRAGLHVQGGFILGFDSDTPSIFQRQIDFIQSSGIVMAMVGLLQAIPGTGLHERLSREGRVTEQLSSGDNVDGTTNIVPRMGLEGLREGYKQVLRHIYAPKHYYGRLKTFLREYGKPAVVEKVRGEHLWAFFRSCIRLGIIGRERWQYWKLLAWTYLRRPELFSLAVTLAIMGHHCRKVCRLHVLKEV
ncbi:MAG: B12-binding domain-containing radical SAM protein [Phycisphaerae bacterium]